MRKLLITLLMLFAAFSFGQTTATFNNLDVRGTSKFRGIPYPFGAVATTPLNPTLHEVAMINNSTFALCRMDFAEFADSIISSAGYWIFVDDASSDTLKNVPLGGIFGGVIAPKSDFITDRWLNDYTNTSFGRYTFGDGALTDSAGGGGGNTAIGAYALYYNHWGFQNTAIGNLSLNNNIFGVGNTAVGVGTLATNYNGDWNIAIGINALNVNTVGDENVAIGSSSLITNDTGSYNVSIGSQSGYNSIGDSNVFLGHQAGYNETTSQKLYIENSNSATPLIYGDFAADSLRLNGNVAFVHDLWYEDTYWRDATVSATALAPGVNAPSLRTIVGGILGYGYAPSVQNDISYGQIQLNHDYKFDTDLEAHMHFMLEEAGEAGDTAVFALEYSWADIDETFATSDTLIILIPCQPITPKQHKLVEFGAITGPGGNNVSSSLIFRLERLQNSVHDTYNGANEFVIVLDVDFHLEIDAPGSRQEYYK